MEFSQSRGKIVFINFWATWCKPCVQEMPSIQNLYDNMKDEDIVFLIVSRENIETVQSFIEKEQYNFPVYHLPEKDLPNVFKTNGIPATFILDREGVIVYKHVGSANWDDESCRSFLQELF